MTPDADPTRLRWTSTITAAATTVTALVAVAVAIWDNVETRKHNRLSVLPYVVLNHVRSDSDDETRAEVVMSNEGVGPAVLRALENRFRGGSGRDTVVTFWGAVAPLITEVGVRITGWADVDSGSALGVQQTQRLLRIEADGPDSGERVQRVLDGLGLRLRYTSIYGDPAEASLGGSE